MQPPFIVDGPDHSNPRLRTIWNVCLPTSFCKNQRCDKEKKQGLWERGRDRSYRYLFFSELWHSWVILRENLWNTTRLTETPVIHHSRSGTMCDLQHYTYLLYSRELVLSLCKNSCVMQCSTATLIHTSYSCAHRAQHTQHTQHIQHVASSTWRAAHYR